MLLFKACPKCNGDLMQFEDSFGVYLRCIQCGLQKDSESFLAQLGSRWGTRQKLYLSELECD